MPASPTRLTPIDALRGLVMVIMALDHTRDFLSADVMNFSPETLARTTPTLFLTRWVTHICAPVFVLTAGMAARLRMERGAHRGAAAPRDPRPRARATVAIERRDADQRGDLLARQAAEFGQFGQQLGRCGGPDPGH